MSWNDQGNNNGSRDPWGRNNNPPPDIDELIKKFDLDETFFSDDDDKVMKILSIIKN